MSDSVTVAEDVKDDLMARGFARRDLARIAGLFGVGAAVATLGRPAWASGGVPDPAPTAKVRIGANECWTGPLMPGQKAAAAMISSSNRYSPHDERGDFIKAVMSVEGVPYAARSSPSARRRAASSPPIRPSNWPAAPPSGSRCRSRRCR